MLDKCFIEPKKETFCFDWVMLNKDTVNKCVDFSLLLIYLWTGCKDYLVWGVFINSHKVTLRWRMTCCFKAIYLQFYMVIIWFSCSKSSRGWLKNTKKNYCQYIPFTANNHLSLYWRGFFPNIFCPEPLSYVSVHLWQSLVCCVRLLLVCYHLQHQNHMEGYNWNHFVISA